MTRPLTSHADPYPNPPGVRKPPEPLYEIRQNRCTKTSGIRTNAVLSTNFSDQYAYCQLAPINGGQYGETFEVDASRGPLPISFNGVTELTEAGSIALRCGSLTDSRVQARAIRLTALAVGSVQSQPSVTEPTSLWAVIDGTTTDPTILRNKNVVSVARGTRYSSGNHVVTFTRDISQCAYSTLIEGVEGLVATYPVAGSPNKLEFVLMHRGGALIEGKFHVQVTC